MIWVKLTSVLYVAVGAGDKPGMTANSASTNDRSGSLRNGSLSDMPYTSFGLGCDGS